MDDVEGQTVSVRCGNALQTANFNTFIIYIYAIMFKLGRCMNSRTLAIVGILIENEDDGSILGLRDTTKRSNLFVCNAVIINAFDIGIPVCKSVGNKAYIFASDTSIGSPINERLLRLLSL